MEETNDIQAIWSFTGPGNRKTEESKLGKEIRISPKSKVTIFKNGFNVDFKGSYVTLGIGIGPDHGADLIMPEEAWEALKGGAEITIAISTKTV